MEVQVIAFPVGELPEGEFLLGNPYAEDPDYDEWGLSTNGLLRQNGDSFQFIEIEGIIDYLVSGDIIYAITREPGLGKPLVLKRWASGTLSTLASIADPGSLDDYEVVSPSTCSLAMYAGSVYFYRRLKGWVPGHFDEFIHEVYQWNGSSLTLVSSAVVSGLRPPGNTDSMKAERAFFTIRAGTAVIVNNYSFEGGVAPNRRDTFVCEVIEGVLGNTLSRVFSNSHTLSDFATLQIWRDRGVLDEWNYRLHIGRGRISWTLRRSTSWDVVNEATIELPENEILYHYLQPQVQYWRGYEVSEWVYFWPGETTPTIGSGFWLRPPGGDWEMAVGATQLTDTDGSVVSFTPVTFFYGTNRDEGPLYVYGLAGMGGALGERNARIWPVSEPPEPEPVPSGELAIKMRSGPVSRIVNKHSDRLFNMLAFLHDSEAEEAEGSLILDAAGYRLTNIAPANGSTAIKLRKEGGGGGGTLQIIVGDYLDLGIIIGYANTGDILIGELTGELGIGTVVAAFYQLDQFIFSVSGNLAQDAFTSLDLGGGVVLLSANASGFLYNPSTNTTTWGWEVAPTTWVAGSQQTIEVS